MWGEAKAVSDHNNSAPLEKSGTVLLGQAGHGDTGLVNGRAGIALGFGDVSPRPTSVQSPFVGSAKMRLR